VKMTKAAGNSNMGSSGNLSIAMPSWCIPVLKRTQAEVNQIMLLAKHSDGSGGMGGGGKSGGGGSPSMLLTPHQELGVRHVQVVHRQFKLPKVCCDCCGSTPANVTLVIALPRHCRWLHKDRIHRRWWVICCWIPSYRCVILFLYKVV
jgi:hypothetical protein